MSLTRLMDAEIILKMRILSPDSGNDMLADPVLLMNIQTALERGDFNNEELLADIKEWWGNKR